MAMDQQETFNWLVNERRRLKTELAVACADRDKWMAKAFDLAFAAARNNPEIREQIERERKAEMPSADVLDFVCRSPH